MQCAVRGFLGSATDSLPISSSASHWPCTPPPPWARVLWLRDMAPICWMVGLVPAWVHHPISEAPKKEMPPWKAKANNGHSFLRARSEHVLMQLHACCVCHDTYRKCGDPLPKLQWMVHAVVHISQFLNVRNVRFEPYGLWGRFPAAIVKQPKAMQRHTDSDSSSPDLASSSSGRHLRALMRTRSRQMS